MMTGWMMAAWIVPAAALVEGDVARVGAATTDPVHADTASSVSARLGGPATVDATGPHAFSLPIPGISREDRRAFSVGNSFFRDNWVVAPASAAGRDGLGPLFNANSCSACHPDDGRGRPPLSAGELGLGAVLFVSPRDADGAPHPVYGAQIQDQAIPGVAPEAVLALDERIERGRYADGSAYELVRLVPRLERPAYGPLGELRVSLRIGPQLIGGGLIEAVEHQRHALGSETRLLVDGPADAVGFTLHVARKVQLALQHRRLASGDRRLGQVGAVHAAGQQHSQDQRCHPDAAPPLGLSDAASDVPLRHVRQLVRKDRRQFIRRPSACDQTEVQADVAARQGEGVERTVTDQEQVPGEGLVDVRPEITARARRTDQALPERQRVIPQQGVVEIGRVTTQLTHDLVAQTPLGAHRKRL